MVKRRIAAICGVCILALGAAGFVFAAEPGSDTDPLISKSYIDSVLLPKIYSYIDDAVAKIKPSEEQNAQDTFEVVNVGAGKTVIASAGTEMILRMGNASVIGSARGGIADVTGGYDLADKAAVPSNHLLIVPLDDGRGVVIGGDGDAILMIKGGYEIKE